MRRIRLKKKYLLSQVMMFFLVAMSFFCFYVGGTLQKEASLLEEDKNLYAMSSQMNLYISTYKKPENLDFLKCNQGNLKIQNIQCLREADDNMCITTIYINYNEKLNYPLVSGKLIDKKKDNIVLLGFKLKEFTYKKGNDDYITLAGDDYRVVGYLGSKYSDALDYETIFYSDRIGTGLQEKILDSLPMGLDLVLESDDFNVSEISENLLYNNSLINQDSLVEENSSINLTETTSGAVYIVIALIFCFANIVIVSEVWLYERYQEIVLRYTFGFTKRRIYAVLFKELLKTSIGACITTYILYHLLFMLFGNEVVMRVLNTKNLIWDFGILFGGTVIIGVIALLYPMWKISKYSIRELQVKGVD